jgi:hypothetical protein
MIVAGIRHSRNAKRWASTTVGADRKQGSHSLSESPAGPRYKDGFSTLAKGLSFCGRPRSRRRRWISGCVQLLSLPLLSPRYRGCGVAQMAELVQVIGGAGVGAVPLRQDRTEFA